MKKLFDHLSKIAFEATAGIGSNHKLVSALRRARAFRGTSDYVHAADEMCREVLASTPETVSSAMRAVSGDNLNLQKLRVIIAYQTLLESTGKIPSLVTLRKKIDSDRSDWAIGNETFPKIDPRTLIDFCERLELPFVIVKVGRPKKSGKIP